MAAINVGLKAEPDSEAFAPWKDATALSAVWYSWGLQAMPTCLYWICFGLHMRRIQGRWKWGGPLWGWAFDLWVSPYHEEQLMGQLYLINCSYFHLRLAGPCQWPSVKSGSQDWSYTLLLGSLAWLAFLGRKKKREGIKFSAACQTVFMNYWRSSGEPPPEKFNSNQLRGACN